MASSDTTATSPEAAKHATQAAVLDRFALIGVFGTETRPGALIRLPNGATRRITLGDTTERGKVAAIGEDYVIIHQGGQTRTLRLPAT